MNDYPIFVYSRKKVIIKPGNKFSSHELKNRLYEMNVDIDLNKMKIKDLRELYDKAISNNYNKIKIFQKLEADTKNYNQIFNSRLRKKNVEEDSNEDIYEIPKKAIIKNEIIDEKKINYRNNMNNKYNNNKRYFRNDNNRINEYEKKDNNFVNVLANAINKKENNIMRNDFYINNLKNQNNEIFYEEDMNKRESEKYENYKNLRNRPTYNKDYNENNKNKEYRINNIRQDNTYIINNNNQRSPYLNQKNNYNISNFNDDYNNEDNSPSYYNNKKRQAYNNINNNDYYNDEDSIDRYNYKNNQKDNFLEQNNHHFLKYKDNINDKKYLYERKNAFRKNPEENYSNNINNNDISIRVSDTTKNKIKNNQLYDKYKNNLNEDTEISNISESYGVQNDAESQNNPGYDIREKLNSIFLILLVMISAIILYIVIKAFLRFGNAVTRTVSNTVEVITNPRYIIRDLLWGLIKSLLLGIVWNYIQVTLPLAIISFVIYKYKKKYEFKQLCKKIIKEIQEEVNKRKNKSITESEIIDIFSKKYKIDKDIFIKKHYKELCALRKKEPILKISQNIDEQGKIQTIWYCAL